MSITIYKLWQLLLKAGPMIWPIMVLSVIALAIIFERIWYLRRMIKDDLIFKQQLFRLIESNQFQEAIDLTAHTSSSSLGRILRAGALRAGGHKDEIMAAMQAAYGAEAFSAKQFLNLVLSIAHIAPMMGFLGSIGGLVSVLNVISARTNVLNPIGAPDVAAGLWQAMLTSIAGLAVGIMSYVFYSCCAHILNNILASWERSINEMLLLLIAPASSGDVNEEEEDVL